MYIKSVQMCVFVNWLVFVGHVVIQQNVANERCVVSSRSKAEEEDDRSW